MKRVELKEYDSYPHHIDIEVRLTDTYYQAHLSYDKLVSMTQHIRAKLLSQIGVSERDLGDGRAGVSVPDIIMTMPGEAAVGEMLVFETRVIELDRAAFRLAHRVVKKTGGLIALMEVTIVAYDYKENCAVTLPEPLRKGLNRLRS
jgi:acyl-CoA thioesterase FadM